MHKVFASCIVKRHQLIQAFALKRGERNTIARRGLSATIPQNRAVPWQGEEENELVTQLCIQTCSEITSASPSTIFLFTTRNGNVQMAKMLQQAASNEQEAVVQLVLEKMADVYARRGFALHMAAGNGLDGIVRRLLEDGADITVKDVYGRTALHKAGIRKAQSGGTTVAQEWN
jgi:hypothetical protein